MGQSKSKTFYYWYFTIVQWYNWHYMYQYTDILSNRLLAYKIVSRLQILACKEQCVHAWNRIWLWLFLWHSVQNTPKLISSMLAPVICSQKWLRLIHQSKSVSDFKKVMWKPQLIKALRGNRGQYQLTRYHLVMTSLY